MREKAAQKERLKRKNEQNRATRAQILMLIQAQRVVEEAMVTMRTLAIEMKVAKRRELEKKEEEEKKEEKVEDKSVQKAKEREEMPFPKGFDALLDEVLKILDTLPQTYEFEEEDLAESHRYDPGFHIEKDGEVFVLTGGSIEYLLDTTYAEDETSMRRFQQFLIKEGIIDALREAGATEESTVRMGEWEFDFVE